MQTYDHRQHAGWPRLCAGAGLLVGSLPWLVAVPEPVPAWPFVLSGSLLVVVGWLFASLRVRVDAQQVHVAFGPGWPRRSLRVQDIVGAETVRSPWWWGYGIRLTPHGWMWNLAGPHGVQVLLADGRRLRIGSDDAEALCAALRTAARLEPQPGVGGR